MNLPNLPKIDKGKALKAALWTGMLVLLAILFVNAGKFIQKMFGFDDDEKEDNRLSEAELEQREEHLERLAEMMKVNEGTGGIRLAISGVINSHVRALYREIHADYWAWLPGSMVGKRCDLYKEVLKLSDEELGLVGTFYQETYSESLTDKIDGVPSGCKISPAKTDILNRLRSLGL